MGNRVNCHMFDEEVLQKMEEFKNDFLGNRYRKEISENSGPNYRERILEKDRRLFEEYLEDEDSQDFLNLK